MQTIQKNIILRSSLLPFSLPSLSLSIYSILLFSSQKILLSSPPFFPSFISLVFILLSSLSPPYYSLLPSFLHSFLWSSLFYFPPLCLSPPSLPFYTHFDFDINLILSPSLSTLLSLNYYKDYFNYNLSLILLLYIHKSTPQE